jgi:hypothetical protein
MRAAMAQSFQRYPSDFRKAMLLALKRSGLFLPGRLTYLEFLQTLVDLKALPSADTRFNNAYDDVWQHTVNNYDWSDEDVWKDERFNPLKFSDAVFETMINTALSLDARGEEEAAEFVEALAPVVTKAGMQFEKLDLYGIFNGYRLVHASTVNNQGRGHSQNIAQLEHGGLLFRSPAEIQLFKALLKAGYLMAPLPVFVQLANSEYKRCEPDFILVKYGLWAVVEVDGVGWHKETPAQAVSRLEGFTDQSVRVIRVPASIASGPEWAHKSLQYINERFEQWRLSK